ncbi:hypothetical protein [Pedobacter rhodius]|uniref:Uncharacterized protein n=1 Tax=Pedobacter rhodius TaxID=3004098 RepID=A0ABT4L0Y3_9SPHI|nr:hypothetical protein [Pedobacter sp. SJ11]MCZ4224841.1 hypothetical protein [Pedobacter sp. SJ11]
MNNSLFSLINEEHFEMADAFIFARNADKPMPNTLVEVFCFTNGLNSFHN